MVVYPRVMKHFIEPIAASSEGLVSTEVGLVLIGGIFLAAGFGVAYMQGATFMRNTRRYLAAQPFTADAIGGSGSVTVTGTVRSLDGDTLTGPLSAEGCVLYEDETLVLRRDWEYDRAERIEMEQKGFDEDLVERKVTTWHTTALERDHVPFVITTEDGAVAIDPTDAELDLPVRASEGASSIRLLLQRLPIVGWLGKHASVVDNPRRRTEKHVKEGDTIRVIGSVEKAADDAEIAGRVDGSDWRFIITTRSPRILALRNFLRGISVNFPALVIFVLGGLLLMIGIFMAIA